MPLPSSIWDENSTFSPRSTSEYSDHRFQDAVFAAATRGVRNIPVLRVRGPDVDGAADHLCRILDDAGRRGDYTELFSTEQSFAL